MRLIGDEAAKSRTRFDLLADIGHSHDVEDLGHAALATAAIDASAVADVCVIEPDERFRRALMRRVLEAGAELEMVVGSQSRGSTLLEVVRTMDRLHGPDGCPWDREQTHQSIAKNLMDECYELLEAIEHGSSEDLREELGDVLLQVIFHAQMAFDSGTFDIDDVAVGLDQKLKRRHPHVFADVKVANSDEVLKNWDEIKQTEKQRQGVFEGVPEALPALAYTQKLLRRATAAGLDQEEPKVPGNEDELGAELFELVKKARATGLDAESALRRAARRYRDRIEPSAPEAR